MKQVSLVLLLFILPLALFGIDHHKHKVAHHKHKEKWYVQKWCLDNNGKAEIRFDDKSRCDCLTDEYAIEFDFARKWEESVGQSLLYGFLSGEKPGIVLIIEHGKNDCIFAQRLKEVIEAYKLPITYWLIAPDGEEKYKGYKCDIEQVETTTHEEPSDQTIAK